MTLEQRLERMRAAERSDARLAAFGAVCVLIALFIYAVTWASKDACAERGGIWEAGTCTVVQLDMPPAMP